MSTIPATFKAYQYESFGEDPFKEIKLNPTAVQAPLHAGEVRVKIFSAALNPADYKLVQQGPSLGLTTHPTPENPFRLGFDLAGAVVELGPDVKNYEIGDEVYGMPFIDSFGSVGEYFNVNTKYLAHKPNNMSWNEAAGVPLAGQTSWQALVTYGKLQKGQRVLILGGSSGTGLFAIQIAKALGAEVITTCSARNVELVKSLGADQVVDYTKEKWADVLAEHSVDLIYDCGMEPASWNDVAQKVLKEKTGIFVTILTVDKPIESIIGATFHQIFNAPCTEYLLEVKKLIEAGQVKTVIDSVHPLENVIEALKVQMSSRARGKIIIEVVKGQ
ncbi:Reticulon-4-interacting protein 1 [Phytophthora citrophthora]|uniref:Reticulon-4-interacting protein 1 n=1 Tax=Phytophthora citrophthora TaxID=4793 RepID=A0AAD9G3R7_9STRA|nr:Reticulon-4-interacting protein 1 [Phytophthora citrophthora]